MRKFVSYLRAYRELDHLDLQARASASHREYVAEHPRWLGDISFCAAYKHAYERAYRHSYARAQVDKLSKFYN